jgi:hypothetical protein
VRSVDAVRSRALIAAVTVLVAALVVVVALRLIGDDGSNAGQSSAAKPTAKPSPSPSRTPSIKVTRLPNKVPAAGPRLNAAQKAAGAEATNRLTSFLAKSSTALARNNGKAPVSAYAAGPALGEIQSLAVQYDHEKMRVSGAPKVLGSEIVAANLSSKPKSVTVAVCLDNSPVIARDAKGRNLSKHRSPSELTVLNLYEVQQRHGDWLVVNHSIPANSSCKQMKLS